MSTLETLASKLADDTIRVMAETGEDRLYMEVAEVIGASSQTLEEAYLAEIRVRLSERTAREFLAKKLAQARSKAEAAKKPAQ